MGHVVGQIEKKRPLAIVLDKLDRALRIAACQTGLIDRTFNDPGALHQRHTAPVIQINRPVRSVVSQAFFAFRLRSQSHIVGIRNPVVGIKTVRDGEILREMPQVPFTDTRGHIISLFERLGDRHFRLGQTAFRIGKQDSPATRTHATANRQSACHQGRPARRTNTGANIELAPALSLLGHPVEMRRANRL